MIDLEKETYGFDDLREIMVRLRRPGDGCPWDMVQTHESIRKNFIEEAYEVCEAIDEKDNTHLCEELGDALLQVVFHTRIAEEEGAFDMGDVCTGICRKMIDRHPHIFGNGEKLHTASETLDVWEEVKRKEKHQQTYTDAMNGVAKCLPSLVYAEKIQKRAKRSGFDWPEVTGAIDKVREETDELQRALEGNGDVFDELGDLLFAAVNVARMKEIDPEEALLRATQKFMRRFSWMEKKSDNRLDELSLEQMIELWKQAKTETKQS